MNNEHKKYAVGYHEMEADGPLCIIEGAEFDTKAQAYGFAIGEVSGPDMEPLCICEFDYDNSRGDTLYYSVLDERVFDGSECISVSLY